MIIETDEHRETLKTELAIYKWADELARMNKRYSAKCAVLIVKNSQIVCGNLANFRMSEYHKVPHFHPEQTILDMYSAELEGISMYVSRLNLNNLMQTSRPCAKCMKAIKDSPEIESIYYRNEKLRIVKEVLK